MKNFTIKQISLYSFLIVLLGSIFSATFVFILVNKIETLNKNLDSYEMMYNRIFEFKYYTERLLTTTNLEKEKVLWLSSKDKLHKSIKVLDMQDKNKQNTILDFWHIIDTESISIAKQLNKNIFSKQNVMEKSILRRLGEGLNSNEQSDYYLAISSLKNSIDYLNQYEEFLLDEISLIKEIQQKNISKKINQTKFTGLTSVSVIVVLAIVFIYIILQMINRIEKKLLKTQNNLQDTLDETNYILNTVMESIMITQNGVCIDINEETLKTFGYKNKNEIVGQSTIIFIAPDSKELAQQKQKDDVTLPYELNCIKKDGTVFPALIKAYNYKNKDGKVIRISAVVDLTYIKSKEQMLFQQSKMATMGEMLENIAHQWRQPLSVITTSSTGLELQKEMGVLTDEVLLKSLEQITNSANHLSETIDDFRSFFKQDKQKHKYNIYDAFVKAEELLSSKFKNRNIKVIEDCDNCEMFGYENELVQAFMNILNNAKDIFEEIKIENKTIFVTIKKEKEFVKVSIKDNAGGIPAEILPSIFNEHFTTKGDKDGTGIGLYMTKMIIEKVHGTIEAQNDTFVFEDVQYTGANFIISLPLS